MGQKIKQWVVESLLTEQTNKTVVTYVGRFHPFHSGHNAVYQHLVKSLVNKMYILEPLIKYNYQNHLLTLKKKFKS